MAASRRDKTKLHQLKHHYRLEDTNISWSLHTSQHVMWYRNASVASNKLDQLPEVVIFFHIQPSSGPVRDYDIS